MIYPAHMFYLILNVLKGDIFVLLKAWSLLILFEILLKKEMTMTDLYNLQRFIDAQDPVYDTVLSELRAGDKRTHWIWFIFPQLKGLGQTVTSQKYGISSLDEAKAFLAHPVLGVRLRDCTEIINNLSDRPIKSILSFPDDLKFRSSMTLFAQATDDNQLFLDALKKYYNSEFDQLTLDKI